MNSHQQLYWWATKILWLCINFDCFMYVVQRGHKNICCIMGKNIFGDSIYGSYSIGMEWFSRCRWFHSHYTSWCSGNCTSWDTIAPLAPLWIFVYDNTKYVNFLRSYGFSFQYENVYAEMIASNWFLLPRKCQKALIILMDKAKQPSKFKVAGVLPLNMNTYSIVSYEYMILVDNLYVRKTNVFFFYSLWKLVNRIYSFVMVLRTIMFWWVAVNAAFHFEHRYSSTTFTRLATFLCYIIQGIFCWIVIKD